MRYQVTHQTRYAYQQMVTLCHNEACLLPRDEPGQRCLSSTVDINPRPVQLSERRDYYGNRVSYFAIQTPHTVLTVTAVSTLLLDSVPIPVDSPPWEAVHAQVMTDISAAGLIARDMLLDSPFIKPDAVIHDYARAVLAPGQPLLEAVMQLTERIHQDFIYDPHSTTVVTPLSEVLHKRRGVCQDFAHLAIACLRSLGIPARYVSGYLETLPPPDQPKLQGVDASHAWFAVYQPGHGWVDFDPTNRQMRTDQYITTAWGRDYGDVTPLKGVISGGGPHELTVAVDVERLASFAP